jgi:hypothetical protein
MSSSSLDTLNPAGVDVWNAFDDSDKEMGIAAAEFVLLDSDEGEGEDDDDAVEEVHELNHLRLTRSRGKYNYSGDLLQAMDGTHTNPDINWNTLGPAEQDRRWLDAVRMPQDVYEALL